MSIVSLYTNIIYGFVDKGILKFKMNCPLINKKNNKIFKINNAVWYNNWGLLTSFLVRCNLPLKYNNSLFGFAAQVSNYTIEREFEIIDDTELKGDYELQLYSYDTTNNILPNNNFTLKQIVSLSTTTGYTTDPLQTTYYQDFTLGTVQIYRAYLQQLVFRGSNFTNTNTNIRLLVENLTTSQTLVNTSLPYILAVSNNDIITFDLSQLGMYALNGAHQYRATITLLSTGTFDPWIKAGIYNYGDSTLAGSDMLFDLFVLIPNDIPNDGWIYINYSVIEYEKKEIEDKKISKTNI
jgi:hypothetical protein